MTAEEANSIYSIISKIDWNVERLVAAACLTALCRDCMSTAEGSMQSIFVRKKAPRGARGENVVGATRNYLMGSQSFSAGGRNRSVINRDCSTVLRDHAPLITGIFYFLVYMGLFWIPGWGSFTVNMIALPAAFLLFFALDPTRFKTKLYLFSTFLVVCWMARAIANLIGYFLSSKVDAVLIRVVDAGNPRIQLYFLLSFCGYVVVMLLISGMILFAVMHMVKSGYGSGQQEIQWQEFFILMIPVANGMVVHGILRFYIFAFEENPELSGYQIYPGMDVRWLCYYVVALASIVSTGDLYRKIRRKQEEENANSLLESQMRDIRRHITEVEKLYTDIRGVKHDLRNHIEVIDSLLANGKTEEARAYAGTLTETVEAFDFSVKTGNPVTDVILHENMQKAAELGITLHSDFHYPVDTGINAFDISVILSNALSNAIEAASGGMVSVSSFRNKNAYLLTVENSFSGTLHTDGAGNFPKTAKSDKKAHGFGLQNIRSVAAKYYGDVQIEQVDGKVVLSVMLMV